MLQRSAKAGGTAVRGSDGPPGPRAMPVEGFPPIDKVLWEIGMILATLLALAFAANILSAHGAA